MENPNLYKRVTGRQNLEYFGSIYKVVDKKHIDEAVEPVKMSKRSMIGQRHTLWACANAWA